MDPHDATLAVTNQVNDNEETETMAQIISILISDFLRPLQDGSVPPQLQQYSRISASAKILLQVVRNALLAEPLRKIRLGNKIIQEKIVKEPGAMDLITAVGFAYCELEDGEKYMVFVPNDDNVGLANLFCTVLQEELDKVQGQGQAQGQVQSSPAKKETVVQNNTNVSGDNTNGNDQFLTEKERKERAIKSNKAKRAQKAERDRAKQLWDEDKEDRQRKQNAGGQTLGTGTGTAADDDSDLPRKIRKLQVSESPARKKPPKESVVQKAERERLQQRWEEDKQQRLEKNERRKQNIAAASIGTEDNDLPLAEPAMNAGTDSPNESLASLRSKAAEAWRIKQGGAENISSENESENMDIDTDIAVDAVDTNVAVEEPTKPTSPSPPDCEVQEMLHVKPAAKPLADDTSEVDTAPEQELLASWDDCLKHIPRCGPATGIRDSSIFYKGGNTYAASASPSPKCLKRLVAEFEALKSSLPSDKQCSAWLRFDEDTPQYLRALLTAPLPGPSPYAGGVFAFDIYIPDNYPSEPPKVQLLTTGRGTVRFGPNLYANGKVCLSLLGTWPGPKWIPKQSSLLQVLVSIQSLLLGVEHPFYLEPGHGGWEDQIKEGDFASVGQTLTGEMVKEEVTLPSQVWLYEDNVRVGSMRYAMLEPLDIATRVGDEEKVKPALAHLSPFEDIIKAHFYHNGQETLNAVHAWITASRPSTVSHDRGVPPVPMGSPPVPNEYPAAVLDSLHKLYPKLESSLEKVCPPTLEIANKTITPADYPSRLDTSTDAASGKLKGAEDESNKSKVDMLRERMQEAAQNSDFILAGQLQKDLKDIEEHDHQVSDLKAKIEEAASQGDYIRAGEFQAKLKSLEEGDEAKDEPANNIFPHGNNHISDNDHIFNNDNEDDNSDEDEDEEPSEDEAAMDYPGQYTHSLGWGSGQQLNGPAKTAATESSKNASEPDRREVIQRLPVNNPCRLRIRLPGSTNESVLEEFDSNEKLAVVYKCVKSHIPSSSSKSAAASPRLVQLRGVSNASGNQGIGVSGGAFANPQSEYGFTLLTAHPKREYSLEMHGSTSLKDLGMVPSAMLTVMMCSSRGQVKRGALESKLAGAQGDAMDVEDLGYEALQELGEKIGVAAPGDGTWKGIDAATLEEISKAVSPIDFLMQKSGQEEDYRCPVCLGDFDPTESEPQLRTLEHCHHTFHSSCLRTWLATKTNCPVCKHSFSQD